MRPIGIVLSVIGAVLLILGFSAADSLASDISEFFTGNPTDRAIWLLIAGAASLAGGLVMLALPVRRTRT